MANTRQRITQRLRTVKFRFHFDGHDQRISLTPGNTIDFGYSRPDEEGYHYAYASLYHNGSAIEYERNSGGRDCDGPIDYHQEFTCPLNRLHSLTLRGGKRYPDWQQQGRTRVHDVYAQQMNY